MEKFNTYTALIKNIKKTYTLLANTSAYIFEKFDNLNWAGFYKNENDYLYLDAFQGKIACTEIPFSKGVCGLAARKKEVVVIDDVHTFEDHIACDSASQSEMVIPLIVNNKLFGLLDLDAPIKARFDKQTQQELIEIANELSKKIEELENKKEV
ncbi:GAF domain-containing protein [Mycoplasma struthionis]|uniref:GAF domain-containing protein n=1 Tax=Mycoplasma struthionis TaxID=538220 RepID=A0A502MJ53_9MOLU|nr:GAF domain-containing protein [Mycoplasma struthionis]TPI02395.1 GAF domain-containing protein [Mycoplasma struthionis]